MYLDAMTTIVVTSVVGLWCSALLVWLARVRMDA